MSDKAGNRTPIALGIIVIIGSLLGGCASSSPGPAAFVPPAPPTPMSEYVIQPGDAIDVTFLYHPDNDQRDLLVRPDGKLLLPFIGETPAAGLTAPQLSAEIEQGYAVSLRDPKVAVNVRALNVNRIFVGGEVTKPGFVTYVPGITAVQAIVQVGGWKDTADLQEVVLLQKVSETSNEYRASKVNLAKVAEEGDTKADIALGPSDVLVLPKSGIAKANLWLQQYVLKMLPIRITARSF
jgi:protein involved in polysaccharide export with SLBB domain